MQEVLRECPVCSRTFGTALRTPAKMTWRGWFFFVLGLLIGIPWGIFLVGLPAGLVLIIPLSGDGLVSGIKLFLGPGYLLARYGFELPRAKRMRCYGCGWRGKVTVAAPQFGARRRTRRW